MLDMLLALQEYTIFLLRLTHIHQKEETAALEGERRRPEEDGENDTEEPVD